MSAWLAARYVTPLFEVAVEKGEIERVRRDLEVLSQTLGASPDLHRFISAPSVKRESKLEVVEKLFSGFSSYTLNFIRVAMHKNRTVVFDVAFALFSDLFNHHRGVTTGTVESAVPLNEDTFAAILKILEDRHQAKLELAREVNPDLIGGIRVRVGNAVIDGSVKGRLQQLKRALVSA